MPTIQIADKPTLDTVKTNTDTTNTKIGNTADSGATASSGSVNGKLNKLITDASTNMGYVKAADGVTGTISTASVTTTASGTKYARVGSFTLAHGGNASVLVEATTSNNYTGSYLFFVSTSNTASPTSSTESGAVAKTPICNKPNTVTYLFNCSFSGATARTYYVYVKFVETGANTRTVTTNKILADVSYNTSTPCASVIKSVQRGIIDIYANGNYVTINTVVPEKCLVTIDTTTSSSTGDYRGRGYLLYANKLVIGNEHTAGQGDLLAVPASDAVCWQVIEFY